MSWSVAEIAALAGKAARGAGAPPAQAARFGPVAAAHLAAGGDTEVLSRALDDLPAGVIIDYPVVLDAALAACAEKGVGRLETLARTPLLECYVAQLPFAARLAEGDGGALLLVADLSCPRAEVEPARIERCAGFVTVLEGLAARTFVPESDASRAAGAGAGLLDND